MKRSGGIGARQVVLAKTRSCLKIEETCHCCRVCTFVDVLAVHPVGIHVPYITCRACILIMQVTRHDLLAFTARARRRHIIKKRSVRLNVMIISAPISPFEG